MLRHMLLLILLPGLACGLGLAQPPYLEKDVADFTAMRHGIWSNDRQVFFYSAAGYAVGDAPGPMAWEIVQADDEDATSSALVRGVEAPQRFGHSLVIGEDRLRETLRAAGTGTPLCEIDWRRRAGGFAGTAEAGRCDILVPDGGDFFLTQTEFEYGSSETAERWVFRRARPFTCWAALLRGSEHGDSGEGAGDWDFRRGLALHDQGGEVRFDSDELPARTIRLKLRDVDWPYGDRRPSLTLYVHEGDAARAVSYAWTGGGEDRIGINLRWLQASCTRTGIQP